MDRGAGEPSSTDDELIARVRTGDRAAFAELYERHHAAALRYARSRTPTDSDADDVVAEVFAGVLAALEHGRGPVDSFAPYLMASVRNECARTSRRRSREEPAAAPTDGQAAPAVLLDEAGVVHAAFESLTPKYRDLLWRIEVQDEPYEDVARRYRISSRAVAMLALRARRALASAYLAGHLTADGSSEPLERSCRMARKELVHLVRGTASGRRRKQLEAHVATCERCRRAHDELGRVNERLRSLPVAPIAAAGVTAAASTGLSGSIKGTLATWWSVGATAATTSVAALAILSPVVLSHDSPRIAEPAAAQEDQAPGTSDEDGPGGSAPQDTLVGGSAPTTNGSAPSTTTSQPPVTTTTQPLVTPTTASPVTTVGANVPTTLTVPAGPVVTTPAVTTPAVTTPAVTTPAVTTPVVTAPPVTTPVVTAPPVSVTVPALPPPPSVTTPTVPGGS